MVLLGKSSISMGHGFQFAMLNNQMVLNGIGFTIISAMQQEPKKNGGTLPDNFFLLGLRKGICPQFSLIWYSTSICWILEISH